MPALATHSTAPRWQLVKATIHRDLGDQAREGFQYQVPPHQTIISGAEATSKSAIGCGCGARARERDKETGRETGRETGPQRDMETKKPKQRDRNRKTVRQKTTHGYLSLHGA